MLRMSAYVDVSPSVQELVMLEVLLLFFRIPLLLL